MIISPGLLVLPVRGTGSRVFTQYSMGKDGQPLLGGRATESTSRKLVLEWDLGGGAAVGWAETVECREGHRGQRDQHVQRPRELDMERFVWGFSVAWRDWEIMVEGSVYVAEKFRLYPIDWSLSKEEGELEEAAGGTS